MTLRLSRGEYWLLANAVEHGLPLPLLTAPEWVPGGTMDTIDIALNRQGHGLEFQALLRTLDGLRHKGWIAFGRTFRCEPIPACGADRIAAFLRERIRFDKATFYYLTPNGGAAWEAFARPRWDRYIEHGHEFPDDDSPFERLTTIEASEWQWLDRYLMAQAAEQTIEPGSLTLAELRPWQATYWKTLPFGLRCTFRSMEHPVLRNVTHSSRMRESWCEWR